MVSFFIFLSLVKDQRRLLDGYNKLLLVVLRLSGIILKLLRQYGKIRKCTRPRLDGNAYSPYKMLQGRTLSSRCTRVPADISLGIAIAQSLGLDINAISSQMDHSSKAATV